MAEARKLVRNLVQTRITINDDILAHVAPLAQKNNAHAFSPRAALLPSMQQPLPDPYCNSDIAPGAPQRSPLFRHLPARHSAYKALHWHHLALGNTDPHPLAGIHARWMYPYAAVRSNV